VQLVVEGGGVDLCAVLQGVVQAEAGVDQHAAAEVGLRQLPVVVHVDHLRHAQHGHPRVVSLLNLLHDVVVQNLAGKRVPVVFVAEQVEVVEGQRVHGADVNHAQVELAGCVEARVRDGDAVAQGEVDVHVRVERVHARQTDDLVDFVLLDHVLHKSAVGSVVDLVVFVPALGAGVDLEDRVDAVHGCQVLAHAVPQTPG